MHLILLEKRGQEPLYRTLTLANNFLGRDCKGAGVIEARDQLVDTAAVNDRPLKAREQLHRHGPSGGGCPRGSWFIDQGQLYRRRSLPRRWRTTTRWVRRARALLELKGRALWQHEAERD